MAKQIGGAWDLRERKSRAGLAMKPFLIKWFDGNGNCFQSIVTAKSRKDARKVLNRSKVSWSLSRIDSVKQILTGRQRVVDTVTTS